MNLNSLISQIRSSSRDLVRQLGLLNNRFIEIGSVSQCHTLVELNTQGMMNLKQLSTVLNLEKSTTSRLVAQLCDEGLCKLNFDTNDRRNKLISLTDKGKLFADQIDHEAKLQVEEALNVMSEEERNAVAHGLSIYAHALKQSKPENKYKSRKPLKKAIPKETP